MAVHLGDIVSLLQSAKEYAAAQLIEETYGGGAATRYGGGGLASHHQASSVSHEVVVAAPGPLPSPPHAPFGGGGGGSPSGGYARPPPQASEPPYRLPFGHVLAAYGPPRAPAPVASVSESEAELRELAAARGHEETRDAPNPPRPPAHDYHHHHHHPHYYHYEARSGLGGGSFSVSRTTTTTTTTEEDTSASRRDIHGSSVMCGGVTHPFPGFSSSTSSSRRRRVIKNVVDPRDALPTATLMRVVEFASLRDALEGLACCARRYRRLICDEPATLRGRKLVVRLSRFEGWHADATARLAMERLVTAPRRLAWSRACGEVTFLVDVPKGIMWGSLQKAHDGAKWIAPSRRRVALSSAQSDALPLFEMGCARAAIKVDKRKDRVGHVLVYSLLAPLRGLRELRFHKLNSVTNTLATKVCELRPGLESLGFSECWSSGRDPLSLDGTFAKALTNLVELRLDLCTVVSPYWRQDTRARFLEHCATHLKCLSVRGHLNGNLTRDMLKYLRERAPRLERVEGLFADVARDMTLFEQQHLLRRQQEQHQRQLTCQHHQHSLGQLLQNDASVVPASASSLQSSSSPAPAHTPPNGDDDDDAAAADDDDDAAGTSPSLGIGVALAPVTAAVYVAAEE